MSTALIQEVRTAVSFRKQVDLVTPLSASDMWSLRQTNTDLINASVVNEDDAADLGKGVYITRTFPSHIDSGGNWNGFLTSEAAAMLTCYGIGAATKSVSGTGFKYAAVAPDFASVPLDLPSASWVVQLQSPGGAVSDKLIFGVICEEFSFEFKEGPGRQNAVFTSNWVGTGGFTRPSGISIPTIYAEHLIGSGAMTAFKADFTGGSGPDFDYLANARIVSGKFTWKNNFRDSSSRYPASGSQSGYQLRGRMRRGSPTISLTMQVEMDSGTSEEDMLIAQTPAVITLTAPSTAVDNSLEIRCFQAVPRATPIADADGIATYNIDWSIQQHPSNGVLEIDAIVTHDNILSL